MKYVILFHLQLEFYDNKVSDELGVDFVNGLTACNTKKLTMLHLELSCVVIQAGAVL